MKGFGSKKRSKNNKTNNLRENKLKEQIIYKAFKFHSEGNISEATKYYQYFIKQGFEDFRVFSNYGFILIGLGKLKEAEFVTRKAIEIKPDIAEAYSNLGNILKNLGKLKEAELSYLKAIKLKPDFADAYYNLGTILKDLGKLKEAVLSYRKAIVLKPDYAKAYVNLGNIFNDIGKLKEAELSYRTAIEIKPDYFLAHYNLGTILKDLGKLKEAEVSLLKAIELNPNFARAYNALSLLKYSDNNQIWQNQLFSDATLNNMTLKDKVDIYFARANVLHKKKEFKNSSKNLQLANDLKINLYPSNVDTLINKSRKLLLESDKDENCKIEHTNSTESIFIVGMPRSGSTLLESILSIRNDVYDLGEINLLEESLLQFKKSKGELSLFEIYSKEISKRTKLNITTNKWLYNYQYSGIISSKIFNAKIIHCYRNPLDNILSIYRANFTKGNQYSSSLIDCANVYLNHDEIMSYYKKRFKSKIYNFSYDSLVKNPKKEIKSLISWLGWNWNDSYLSPHLNLRSVSTRSNVEVRSPINSKSIDGWKNYKDMLQPAVEIITKTDRYRYLLPK